MYRAGLDDPDRCAADRNSCPSAGQARANGRERDADRVADPESSGAVGRRGLLGLSAAPWNAVLNRQHVSFPKCQVLSPSALLSNKSIEDFSIGKPSIILHLQGCYLMAPARDLAGDTGVLA